MPSLTTANGPDFIGQELALTDWLPITQRMVDAFADATLDPDWMHVDVERSRRESPFDGTIVQGFLMSSLVIYFSHEYGVRPTEVEPAPAGRGRPFRLHDVVRIVAAMSAGK